jgi:glycosyltransferase involved in cell wall biosynthesis
MKKIIFLLPSPPPVAGPELIAEALTNSRTIRGKKDIRIINANINTGNATRGTFTLQGFFNFLVIILKFTIALPTAKILFTYLSSSRLGFIKDAIFIWLASFFFTKVVTQYHGSHFQHFYTAQSGFYKKFIRLTLSRTSKVLVLAESLKSIFQGICDETKIDVLQNGLVIKSQTFSEVKTNISFNILFMGHLIYSKGFYELVRAYKKLYQRYSDNVSLQFAGENIGYSEGTLEFLSGEYYDTFRKHGLDINDEIQDFIRNAKIYNAQYLGFISGEKKEEILAESDLFVLPSYTEGFSMACLEAMAAGLPVIATPVGAMNEVVKDGVNGVITPVGDVDKLVENIRFFIDNPDEHKKIGSYNPSYVKVNYNIEVVAQKLLNILGKA